MNTYDEVAIKRERGHFSKFWGYYLFILLESAMILLYGLFTTYGKDAGPKTTKTELNNTKEDIKQKYPFYQDVNVMIFIGFGFLMTFLKKYSWSAVGKNFLMAAWTIQVSLLSIGFWRAVLDDKWLEKIELNMEKIINADFAAASILIAFGAVLGRLNLIQYLIMATIQTIIYGLSMNLCFESFTANDIGGSMTIHLFGAYFGLTVAFVVKRKDAMKDENNSSNYISNIFSMIGTIFLWMYWPSFNGALSSGNAQQRCIINTLISLTGSCVMVFLLTPFTKKGKLHMEFILNATLAGGVIIGSASDIILYPWIAFIIGCGGGTISLIGFEFIGPFLNRTIGLQDTCGVHSLHGIPGLVGGIISAIVAGTASYEDYGDSLTELFPKLPLRTNRIQGVYQLATIGTSLGLAIVSGYFTGWILNSPCFETVSSLFNDEEVWVIESEAVIEEKEKFNKKITDYEMVDQDKKDKETDRKNHLPEGEGVITV